MPKIGISRELPSNFSNPGGGGSSGHVPGGPRNRATTRVRRRMVMRHSKWFNEMDGEQAASALPRQLGLE